ncbi:MAG: DUF4386 domain-containing protein [Actinoallomurus sp.]
MSTTIAGSRTVYARLIGALFLAGFLCYGIGFAIVSSVVGGRTLLSTVAAHPTLLTLGAFLMLLNSVVDVGKGVLFFPILENHGRRTALVYLATMIVEVVLLAVGVLCILLLVPLARQTVGTGQANADWAGGLGALAVQGNAMSYQVAEMLLGLGCIFLCSLLFRARLVPRLLAMWGAIGYAILMTGAVAEIFGIHIGLVFSIPGGLFELTLGVWLIVRGFRPPAYGDRVETVRTVDRSPSFVHAVAEGETR